MLQTQLLCCSSPKEVRGHHLDTKDSGYRLCPLTVHTALTGTSEPAVTASLLLIFVAFTKPREKECDRRNPLQHFIAHGAEAPRAGVSIEYVSRTTQLYSSIYMLI